MATTEVHVRGIKLTVAIRPEALPREGVPMEGPIPDLDWEIVLEGGGLRLHARLNGKNYRKMLKAIDANAGNVSVMLQGNLQPAGDGEPLRLESAGFQVNVRTPRPPAGFEASPPAPAPHPAPAATATGPSTAAASELLANAAPAAAPVGLGGEEGAPAKAAIVPAPSQPPAPLPGTALPGRRIYVPQAAPRRRS